jgi:chain length determinant protein (polysaccharide antigen chain regulator)
MAEALTPGYPDDEIDLRELALSLWDARRLIAVITVVVLAVAAAYAFLWPATYEADAKTLPPAPSDLESYNSAPRMIQAALASGAPRLSESALAIRPDDANQTSPSAIGIKEINPKDAYAVFLRYAQSASLRDQFFKQVYLPAFAKDPSAEERDALRKRLNKALSVTQPKGPAAQVTDELTVAMQGRQPQAVADWANTYVKMALQAATQQLAEDRKSAVQAQIKSLEVQITALRTAAANERKLEIERTQAALQLAQAIHLEQPSTSGNLITSYTGPTLYMRGAAALQTELDQLKARTSDDPYIKQLPQLLYAQGLIEKIDLDPKGLAVATIDQPALAPLDPVKPKKALALVLGLVLGLALGVMAALVRQAWRKPRAGVATVA